MELTNKEMFTEYARCYKNPEYCIENYFKIYDKIQEKIIPIKLFSSQKEVLFGLENNRFNIIKKYRQAGGSTITNAYIAFLLAFSEETEHIAIINYRLDLSCESLKQIREYLLQLPRWVWGPEYYGNPKNEAKSIFLTDSKKAIRLPNGSQINVLSTHKDALRGFTPTYLIIDDAAYIHNSCEIFEHASVSLTPLVKSRYTLLSTPNGTGNLFHRTYENAIMGQNSFNITNMKWYEDLRFNKELYWVKKDMANIKEIKFTTASFLNMFEAGYKPTSPWYEGMSRNFNNEKWVAQDIDAEFVSFQ